MLLLAVSLANYDRAVPSAAEQPAPRSTEAHGSDGGAVVIVHGFERLEESAGLAAPRKHVHETVPPSRRQQRCWTRPAVFRLVRGVDPGPVQAQYLRIVRGEEGLH